MLRKKQRAKIRLKFVTSNPTDENGKKGQGCVVHCYSPGSDARVSDTNKALKENVLNSLFTYY